MCLLLCERKFYQMETHVVSLVEKIGQLEQETVSHRLLKELHPVYAKSNHTFKDDALIKDNIQKLGDLGKDDG